MGMVKPKQGFSLTLKMLFDKPIAEKNEIRTTVPPTVVRTTFFAAK
jgi:hypothetical protein